jgi:hypothetical protein
MDDHDTTAGERCRVAKTEQQPSPGVGRQLDLLPQLALKPAHGRHRDVTERKRPVFPWRGNQPETVAVPQFWSRGQLPVERLDQLLGNALYSSDRLGEKTAVDIN